jgi:serine protease Do
MNSIIKLSVIALIFVCGSAAAQTADTKPKKQKEESITIRKNGNSKEKLTIVVDGDKITVNGKPVEDFKSENIEIRRGSEWGRPYIRPMPPMAAMAPRGGVKMFREDFLRNRNKAVLGVGIEKTDEGVKITGVTKESGAEKAGLKEGDIITKIGDKKVEESKDVFDAIGKHNADDKVAITYKREGKENTTTATLGKNEMKFFGADGDNHFDFNFDGFDMFVHKPRLGLQVQDTEDGKGVKITEVEDEDAPAGKAGLKEGDVITSINGKAVTSVDEIKDVLKDLKEGDTVNLQYTRDNKQQSADVKIPKRLKTSNL